MDKPFQYETIEGFVDFHGITDESHFHRVPEEWFIFITDVKGSTKAIEQGRYKDVNTVGAASISVVRNALGKDFASVFGGDGATLLVSPADQEKTAHALRALQELSRQKFGLNLRVGQIQVSDVIKEGALIEVAKHELIKGKCVAVFRGGGLALAEKMIKGDESRYCFAEGSSGEADLTGLSCRWDKIPNQRGKVLSLLVVAREDDAEPVYRDVLGFLNSLFDGDFNVANPVNPPLMKYKSLHECLADETRYEANRFSWRYFYRVFEILLSVLIFKGRMPALIFDSGYYQKSMRTHSDYRKFDDMLRMVLDCSPAHISQIRDYLDSAHQKGILDYGMHESDHALMTCFVQDVQDGNHIHFIDGDNGGYAMAAKELKMQMKRRSS